MEPKEVLNNFLKEDPLLTAIKDALKEVSSGEYVSRAIRAQAVLESALAEHEVSDIGQLRETK